MALHSKTADNAGEMLDCIWNMTIAECEYESELRIQMRIRIRFGMRVASSYNG